MSRLYRLYYVESDSQNRCFSVVRRANHLQFGCYEEVNQMATCNLCQAQYEWGQNPCWRCEQDNTFWEEQRNLPRVLRFRNFFWNVWGIIAIVINLFAFALLLWTALLRITWGAPGASNADLLGQGLAWFMSFISIFVVYAVRFQLWNYSWVRNILKPQPPSLYTIAVILFLLGILLLLTYLSLVMFFDALTADQGVIGSQTDVMLDIIIAKIVMPAMYGFVFALFTAGSMFMSAGLFVERFNERGGQPVFMNTRLLTDVVQKAAADSLEIPLESTRPAGIKRTEQGGIEILLNCRSTGVRPGSSDEGFDRRYQVKANRWGQIDSLVEDVRVR
jgi:hypothetical protein